MGNEKVTSDVPFMAFVSDEADLAVLKTFAETQSWSQADINQGDIKTAIDFLKNKSSPQLLMVEVPSAAAAPDLLDKLADVCGADTKVIVIGTVNEYSFYCWLTDIGISSYLLRPLAAPAVETAYHKSLAKAHDGGKPERAPGKVFSVVGTRGGVGATTIALNLAGLIADRAPKLQIALVDLDPYDGSIALSLDLDPSHGMREALEKPERLDALFLDRVTSKPLKNLSVLSSEEALNEPIVVHDDALEVLLRELKVKFDVIIFDLPRKLDGLHRKCLKYSDQVILVSELSLISLRDGLRIMDLMRDNLKLKPPVIVANRSGIASKMEMQVADYEKGVNSKVTVRVPFAPDVFMPIGSDIPSVKKKTHVAMKPLTALLELLLPELKPKTPEKKSGLFKK